jgi:uracil-DNA glycosylase
MRYEGKKAGIVPDTAIPTPMYDASCRRCPRLAKFLEEVRTAYPRYWCLPVPPFGDSAARLVIVGLAPGMHGANATGRPFTGDFAGVLLYETLHA